MEAPASTTDIARGNSCPGTSRIVSAAAIDQKPPSAMPSTTRPASNTPSDCAVAAITLESSSRAVSANSTQRRSKRRVNNGTAGAATAAMSAVAVTA